MSPQIDRPVPPYRQITRHYRDLIGSGELRPGDRLPPVRQLVARWGVAHATAAKVVAILRAEGLVTTTPGGGGGTTVNPQNPPVRSPVDRPPRPRKPDLDGIIDYLDRV